jgi:indoleamine 2,3-dioxygenase
MNIELTKPVIDNLDVYQVHPERGFLPEKEPLVRLPSKFDIIENIAANLSALLITGRYRNVIDKIQFPDISQLETERQIKRAFLLMSFFGNAYVWGGETPATVIPQSLAIPLCKLANILERPPIVAFGSIVLDNWRRIDKTQPIELNNIAPLQLFLGGIDEYWFYATAVAIEAKGAPALISLVEAQKFVNLDNTALVIRQLQKIVAVIARIQAIFKEITNKCDPYIYYHRVRPFFGGWREPGVIYEGVSDIPQMFVGGSAAQSSLLQSLDAGLGIKHDQEKHESYLRKIRVYMPVAHRQFIEALERGPSIREFVLNNQENSPILRECYNECVQGIEHFRQQHIKIAANYITKQAPHNREGTGSTNFGHFLREVKQQTTAHLIS